MTSFESAKPLRVSERADSALRDHGRSFARQTRSEGAHLQRAVDVLRRRWRADIVWCLRGGPLRFNALLATLAPVSHKVLTEQLRALEYEGVIARDVAPGAGRHVVYRLTPLGADLPPILESLRAWGAALPRSTRERPVRDHATLIVRPHDVTGRSRFQAGEP